MRPKKSPMRSLFRTGVVAVMLCGLVSLQPLHAQAEQPCEGSTVDTQGAKTAKAARAFLTRLNSTGIKAGMATQKGFCRIGRHGGVNIPAAFNPFPYFFIIQCCIRHGRK